MKTSVLRRLAPTLILGSTMALGACSGPPVASALEDEEICADYESAGHDKMLGGMRLPVVVTIFDGAKAVVTKTLHGLRDPKAPKSQILLPDADAEYKVVWAQCAAKQAERKAAEGPDPAYKCGDLQPYRTEKLVTKKGDAASRTLRYALPPDATCLIGAAPPEPAAK